MHQEKIDKKIDLNRKIDLEIIILNFNTQFWLKKTLTSLTAFFLEKTKYTVKVTVVDNNSQDESVSMLTSEFPWVTLIESSSNGGFAAGNNLALKQTKATYVMLLNSDVECTELSFFDRLIEYVNTKSEVAVITPYIMLPTGQIDPACHRGEPTLWASFTYFLGLEKMFPTSSIFSQYHQWYKSLKVTHEIDACSGACMLVRTEAMKKIGLLDEQFFMYAEDLDWCKRFRDKNYKIVFKHNVKIIHHKYKSGLGSTTKKVARQTSEHFYDTMLQYYDKHYANANHPLVRQIVKVIIQIRKGVL